MFGGITPGRFSKMYRRYIEHYPKDSVVRVYYDPTKSENAMLEPHETKGVTKYCVLASFLVVCGIVFVINFFTGLAESIITFIERSK